MTSSETGIQDGVQSVGASLVRPKFVVAGIPKRISELISGQATGSMVPKCSELAWIDLHSGLPVHLILLPVYDCARSWRVVPYSGSK